MSTDLVDNPTKIIELCNRYIHFTEELLEKSRETGDLKEQSRLNGQLLGWVELLEKATHQNFQQGRTRTDITRVNRKRYS